MNGLEKQCNYKWIVSLDTSPYDTRLEADVQQVVLRNRDANARFKSPILKQLKTFVIKIKLIFLVKIHLFKRKIRLERKRFALLDSLVVQNLEEL